VIKLRSVSRSFPGRGEVLRGVDLDVGEGEFVAVVGRSGSGKTTLLNIVGGLDLDFEGDVEVAGRDLRELDDRALSSLRSGTIGFVFQAYHILDHLTVGENAALPALFSRSSGGPVGDRLARRVSEVLEAVGLSGREGDRPADFSGGERQRVAIARALLLQPRLLLCDEPTGNLDRETGAAVVDLLRRIHGDGVTVLVVTHDEEISHAAGRVLELRDGGLEGPAAAEAGQ